MFGHLGYDLKNETEKLSSAHPDRIGFPDLYFFVPQVVVELTPTLMRIGTLDDSAERVYSEIVGSAVPVLPNNLRAYIPRTDISSGNSGSMPDSAAATPSFRKQDSPGIIRQRYTQEEYVQTIRQLKEHILRGDCYEINFCQEFYAEDIDVDPVALFMKLGALSPNPFS
ncbi:MAG: hypothetical protein EOO94_03815, partial [Pedobacter sp.]